MSLERLVALLPEEIHQFLERCRVQRVRAYLVGGAVRDLLMGAEAIHDWDFELHHESFDAGGWKRFLGVLRRHYSIDEEAHCVARIKHQELNWQIAPARREVYAHRESWGHGDFESVADPRLSFADASARRDFTVNAMGALYQGGAWELVDPWGGKNDLARRELVAVDAKHFVKDPVRLLRAYRFRLSLGLQFSASLEALLEEVNLEALGPYHLAQEAHKSRAPFSFWNQLQHHRGLEPRFSGGVLSGAQMDEDYRRYLPEVGSSNAILAAVVLAGEGWHTLLALASKGESEVTVWRQRREALQLLRPLSKDEVLALPSSDPAFVQLTRLVRTPLQWPRLSWAQELIRTQGPAWLLEVNWEARFDLQDVPAAERAAMKVRRCLQS